MIAKGVSYHNDWRLDIFPLGLKVSGLGIDPDYFLGPEPKRP